MTAYRSIKQFGYLYSRKNDGLAVCFEALALWLGKLGIPQVQACLEATGSYGEDLAIYLHEAGHSVRSVMHVSGRLSICQHWYRFNAIL